MTSALSFKRCPGTSPINTRSLLNLLLGVIRVSSMIAQSSHVFHDLRRSCQGLGAEEEGPGKDLKKLAWSLVIAEEEKVEKAAKLSRRI